MKYCNNTIKVIIFKKSVLSVTSDLATLSRKSFKDHCFFLAVAVAHLKADLSQLTTK